MLDCGGRSAISETTVRAAPAIQVSLTPQSAQVALLGQIRFLATVSGSSAGVSWSANGVAGGSLAFGVVSGTGLYTAPTTLPSPNTITVTGASLADSTRSASASVTIVNPPPAISSISPDIVPLGTGNTTLTVNGTGFTSQSVVEMGGTALATSNQLLAVATDNAGNVIWYYDYGSLLGIPQPINVLPNGHMPMNLASQKLVGRLAQEIDLAGNIISQFTFGDLKNWLSAAGYNLVVHAIHYDILPLPNGHLILLVNHYQNFTNLTG